MKALYISIFVLGSIVANAQSNLYNKLNSFLTNQTKEIVANRMIAINVWSLNDKSSRELNKEFEKVYSTYDYAKLKGGSQGIIVLNINIDSDLINPSIILQKDGVTKSIAIPSDNIEIINALKDKIKLVMYLLIIIGLVKLLRMRKRITMLFLILTEMWFMKTLRMETFLIRYIN